MYQCTVHKRNSFSLNFACLSAEHNFLSGFETRSTVTLISTQFAVMFIFAFSRPYPKPVQSTLRHQILYRKINFISSVHPSTPRSPKCCLTFTSLHHSTSHTHYHTRATYYVQLTLLYTSD